VLKGGEEYLKVSFKLFGCLSLAAIKAVRSFGFRRLLAATAASRRYDERLAAFACNVNKSILHGAAKFQKIF
jgi:hypothetical protein